MIATKCLPVLASEDLEEKFFEKVATDDLKYCFKINESLLLTHRKLINKNSEKQA